MKICNNCGIKLVGDERVCPSCGLPRHFMHKVIPFFKIYYVFQVILLFSTVPISIAIEKMVKSPFQDGYSGTGNSMAVGSIMASILFFSSQQLVKISFLLYKSKGGSLNLVCLSFFILTHLAASFVVLIASISYLLGLPYSIIGAILIIYTVVDWFLPTITIPKIISVNQQNK